MNPTEQTCNTNQIEDYLEEFLSDSARMEFEEHLTHCERCQNEIQRRAAEPGMWRDAVELLGNSTGDPSTPLEEESHAPHRSLHALSVLDSLTPTDDPEMLGRIGDYEISGVVGVGGMGAVLKGFDKSLRRVVAIKVMAPHLADSGSARSRFQREARAAAAITHNNVIDTYGVSEANGLPYIVMPFARGPSLQKRIDESGPLTAIEVVRIGRQIASGLAAAHEQGLVHRDIKPANILLNEGIERLWITDFGVARAVDDASMTQTGVIAGTPQYMSPEQARGESVDPRSDLFSMGSVLYTACTGRPPFRSETAYGILRRITDTDPRPIREIHPEIPEWLCGIIDRLMAKHPADRFQEAEEVAELFEACLAHLQQPTQVELPPCVMLQEPSNQTGSKARNQNLRPSSGSDPVRTSRFRRPVVLALISILLVVASFAGSKLTEPSDIAGQWSGETWNNVSLSSVEEAADWYTGSFTDAEGHRGALQLEWSRWQRRYNGRWKMGDENSGSITLRMRDGELRGAIAMDPDSQTSASTPRLREFAWQRGARRTIEPKTTPDAKTKLGRPILMESPTNGRIVRWGDGIYENAPVKKGDLIAELGESDSISLDRLKEQQTAAKTNVEATQTMLNATEKNLASAETIVATLTRQRNAYEEVKKQIGIAANAVVESAKNKVSAESANLEEVKAALPQLQAEFDRNKLLFEEKVISQLKLQESERKLKEAEAKAKKAEAYVEAAKNDLIAKQTDAKAKDAKAQTEVDYAIAALNNGNADVAKAESEVVQARQDLAKARKTVRDLEAKLARQNSYQIRAPVTGFVTNLTGNTALKQGDVICKIWPKADPGKPKAQENAATNSVPTPRAFSPQSPVERASGFDVSRHALISGWPIMETVGAATSLGQRLREFRKRLGTAEQEGQSGLGQDDIARLKRGLAAAKFERETAVAILQSQLEAAKKLNDSQTRLRDMVKLQIDEGRLDPFSLPPTEQAVVKSAKEIRQFELLLKYYTRLGKEDPTSPEDDRTLAVEILKIQYEAAKNQLSFQMNQTKLIRRRFELGEGQIEEFLKAEQAEATATAEARKLEALLLYCEQFGWRATWQDVSPAQVPRNNESSAPTKTEQERQAILGILSAQLEAATAKRNQAQQDYERQKTLFESGLVSAVRYQAAEAAFVQSEVAIKELNLKIDYYKSDRFGNTDLKDEM